MEEGQGDGRESERLLVEMAENKGETPKVGVSEAEMIRPDAPLEQAFERGGYEGSSKFDESELVAAAVEGEFLTPFQKEQRLKELKKNMEEGGVAEEDEPMAA